MYDYPDSTTIQGLLSYPTQGNPYFWLWILGGIFAIMSFTSYYKEVSVFGKGRIISSFVVSSFFITLLAGLGTLAGFITNEIMIYILIFFALFTAIFLFSGKD